MKNNKYFVVSKHSLDRLVEKINELLEEKGELVGGIHSSVEDEIEIFYQAMLISEETFDNETQT